MINNNLFLMVIAGMVAFFFLMIFFKGRKSEPLDIYEYKQIDIMSKAERSFYGVLKIALPENIEIFTKVRIADLLKPSNKQNNKIWRIAFNKISSKHFDFVLCDKKTLKTIAVIELDDSSHNTTKAQIKDQFINEACKSGNLTIVRFKAKKSYQPSELLESIFPTEKPVVNQKSVRQDERLAR